MHIYLVGGAVRDQLLGLPDHDKDWVVVGATPQKMLDQGYQAVGKDFPVFLHPETKEEYALARKERKTGQGYGGFSFNTDPEVTLEEDLLRRDLTINAMARGDDGVLVDPFGGQSDLAERKLKHVSNAFSEDPLRVLRVARFYARFHHLGFEIEQSTFALMQQISESGELLALAPDRLWVEMSKGLSEPAPSAFIDCLCRCKAMASLMPEFESQFKHIDPLANAEQKVGKRVLSALNHSVHSQLTVEERWGIICHALDAQSLGDSSGPRNLLLNPPASFQTPMTLDVCERFRATKRATRIAVAVNGLLPSVLNAKRLKPDYILHLLEHVDAFRESSVLEPVVRIAQSINATDPESPSSQLASITLLLEAQRRCADLSARQYVDAGLKGEDIASAMRGARKMIIKDLMAENK